MQLKQFMAGAAVVFATSFWGCNTVDVDPAAQDAATENARQIADYAARNNLTANLKQTGTGLNYVITKANPTGKQPAVGEELAFLYTLSNLSGVKVDSAKGGTPLYLPFGASLVLPGLEEGLSLMREGETAVLLLPSAIAYGSNTQGAIGAFQPVRFDIQLLRSRTEDEQIAEYITANKLNVTSQQSNGLRVIKTLSQPTATDSVKSGKSVTVVYSGRTIRNATAFDSGTLEVVVGADGTVATSQGPVVRGFGDGIKNLKVGEKATIIFPSAIGYGKTGVVNQQTRTYVISPYNPLIFDVEIKAIK